MILLPTNCSEKPGDRLKNINWPNLIGQNRHIHPSGPGRFSTLKILVVGLAEINWGMTRRQMTIIYEECTIHGGCLCLLFSILGLFSFPFWPGPTGRICYDRRFDRSLYSTKTWIAFLECRTADLEKYWLSEMFAQINREPCHNLPLRPGSMVKILKSRVTAISSPPRRSIISSRMLSSNTDREQMKKGTWFFSKSCKSSLIVGYCGDK